MLLFFFRKIVLLQINLVLKSFGDSTTDCVTEKILTLYLLKCKLVVTIIVIALLSNWFVLVSRHLHVLANHSFY